MKVGTGKSQSLGQRWNFPSKKIGFIISDTANVLHRTRVVFWDEDLVVLIERIFSSEEFRVEFDTSLSNVEHLIEVAITN